MSSTTILIIVASGVGALLILVVIGIMALNRRKAKKLQESLKKIKQEDKNQELEAKNIALAQEQHGQNVSEEEIFGSQPQAKSGGFFTGGDEQQNNRNMRNQDFDGEFYQPKEDVPRMPNREDKHDEELERQEREKDFEKFLDEHAFSRKVFDKSLLEKIQKLPPEIKSIIMGNVFDKFNDDDDK